MLRTLQVSLLTLLVFTACQKDDTVCALGDSDCDGVPDDLGCSFRDKKDNWIDIDIDEDGTADGPAVDTDCDGDADGLLLDTDGDGLGDAVDLDGDYKADIYSEVLNRPETGGSPSTGGTPGTGGAPDGTGGEGAGGTPMFATGGSNDQGGGCLLGDAVMTGAGQTTYRWQKVDVQRNGMNYKLIANGWGPKFESQTISWSGTSFTVEDMTGSQGDGYEPASYPSVYCGAYSDDQSLACGLPAPISSITTLPTGLRWSHPAGAGEYNVAYDIWLGNSGAHSGFFMVWLRDPPGQRPAGSVQAQGVTVPGVTGVWDIWTGHVLGLPIINYVRPEGQDSHELAFDIVDFFADATSRGHAIPGNEIRSVAIGFEIWNGPISGLKADDFCVQVN